MAQPLIALNERKAIDPFTAAMLAHNARVLAGQEKPPYDIDTLLCSTLGREVHVTGDRLPAGALVDVVERQGVLTIHYSRGLGPLRRRFVLCHAVAHVLFDALPVCCVAGRNTLDGTEELLREHCADSFAAELLCPIGKLYQELAYTMEFFPPIGIARVVHDENDAPGRLFNDEMDRLADLFAVDRSVVEGQFRRLRCWYDASPRRIRRS